VTTGISWCQETWNPVTGCEKVSDGCKNCYAEKMAKRIAGTGNRRYLPVIDTKTGRWTRVVRTWPEMLDVPLRRKKPTVYFVGSMTDMFHKDVPFEFLAAVFAVMAACPQHRFMMLTKRPARMAEIVGELTSLFRDVNHRVPLANWYANQRVPGIAEPYKDRAWRLYQGRVWRRMPREQQWPLRNVALGTSIEHQAAADERIPLLRDTPAHRRFLSLEPLLGPVRVDDWSGIDLAIIGCESGPKRRETKLEWIQDLGQSVLDAQVRAVPQIPNPDPEGDGWIETGPEQCVSGPRMHIKQAAVCKLCAGSGLMGQPDDASGCTLCGGHLGLLGSGVAGKVRGKNPDEPLDIYIPGYGTRTWREDINW
jgi:protein gp37